MESEREKKHCGPSPLSQPAAHKGTGRTVTAALPLGMMPMRVHHSCVVVVVVGVTMAICLTV